MTVQLVSVSTRGALRSRGAAVLANVSLEHGRGVLGVVGAPQDGTTLLFDVIDGTAAPRSGRVTVFGASPSEAHRRIARVSLEAPLPDSLRVEEVFDLAADLRAGPRRPAALQLGALAAGPLAQRLVRTLSPEERRVVALAVALGSDADVLLVEEPLAMLDPVAPRLVMAALRARARSSCVIVTTASVRDAVDVADRLAVLSAGVCSPLPTEVVYTGADRKARASVRVVVSPAVASGGVAALVEALTQDDAIMRVDTSIPAGRPGAAAVVASGADLARVSKAITRAIGTIGIDVELVEPEVVPAPAIRAALAVASGLAATRAHPEASAGEGGPGVAHASEPSARRGGDAPEGGGKDEAATRRGPAWVVGARALVAAPLARLVRTRRGWGSVVGWSAFGVFSALAARSAHTSGADYVLRGSFGQIVVPLLAYGIVSAVVGGKGLRSSIRGLVALGAAPKRAALGSSAVAVVGAALVAAVLAAVLCVVAHGPNDAPLSTDVPASFGVAFLGGAAYAAYFSAGSAIGRTGALRGVFLVADWLVGSAAGLAAVFTPRGHLASLLGGPLCFDLPRRVSCVALVLVVVVYLALAARASHRPARRTAAPRAAAP